jgi:hypothetical protein
METIIMMIILFEIPFLNKGTPVILNIIRSNFTAYLCLGRAEVICAFCTLKVLCYGRYNANFNREENIPGTVMRLLLHDDREFRNEALIALKNLTEYKDYCGLCAKYRSFELTMCNLTQSAHRDTKILAVLCNVVRANNQYILKLMEYGLKKGLFSILAHVDRQSRSSRVWLRHFCFLLRVAMEQDKTIIQEAIDFGAIKALIEHEEKYNWVLKSVVPVLACVANGTYDQIRFLAENGAIPIMCKKRYSKIPEIVLPALQGLYQILHCGDVLSCNLEDNEFASKVNWENVCCS